MEVGTCRVPNITDRESGPMSLGQTLSGFWHSIQADLFPWLEEELGPLGERYRRLVTCLSLRGSRASSPISGPSAGRGSGGPCAFIAKAVFDAHDTRPDRAPRGRTLRRLCGWTWRGEIPSEATFSRAFAEREPLPERLHEALIEQTLADHLVACLARRNRDRGAREAGTQTQGGETQAQARPPAQGRGAAQGAAAWNASSR